LGAVYAAGDRSRLPEPLARVGTHVAKEELRVLANTILDIRLQMLNMTDQEALT
jgi:hypothetical protein